MSTCNSKILPPDLCDSQGGHTMHHVRPGMLHLSFSSASNVVTFDIAFLNMIHDPCETLLVLGPQTQTTSKWFPGFSKLL